MASLREIRRRIRSVANTEKITRAMELVAASKMRRAQERVVASRPYADEIASVIADLMSRPLEYRHPYLEKREVRRRVVLLITSDRGTCGALNSNNVRLALQTINDPTIPADVITLGRKGRDMMRRLRKNLIADRSPLGDRPNLEGILPAINVAMDEYEKGNADEVIVVFAKFLSAGRQQATALRVLPVQPPTDANPVRADFLYEPEPEEVLKALLPRYVESQVYRVVLENSASEQAARMLAMRNASDNAADVITSLTLTANKVRQETITTELMEIVSGATALEASA